MKTTSTLLSAVFAIALLATACGSTDDSAASATTEPGESVVDQISLDEETTTTAEPADTTDDPSTTVAPTTTAEPTTEPTVVDEVTDEDCTDPPAANDLRWVDVSLDDPDGGLNVREAAGVENDIVAVFPRRTELFTTGGCTADGAWWEVTTGDGSVTGWVASRYLSDAPVIHGGLGFEFSDTDNEGLEAPDLETLVRLIAESYGHDEDLEISAVGEIEAADAIGGTGTWDTSGLKDDASIGYRITIEFEFVKDEDNGGEIVGYRADRITNASICSRGVTDDGRCV